MNQSKHGKHTNQRVRALSNKNIISLTFFAVGLTVLLFATLYVSSFLAIVGLGLVFWGILFTYIRTEEYMMKSLLNDAVSYQQSMIQRIALQLKCKGKPIFLPPRYFADPETYKAFIPKKEEISLPTSEFAQKETIIVATPSGILLTPPGASLTRRFEKILETNFTRVDLKYLQLNLPKIIIQDLEIAQDFEINIENKKIITKTKNCIFKPSNITNDQESDKYLDIWSPLDTAIACAIARATGQPVIIEKLESNNNGTDLKIEYQIIDEAQLS